MMRNEVMSPEHHRWPDFCQTLTRLLNKYACDHDHHLAERAMAELGGIDIPESIALFCKHGGYCDCEIILNIVAAASDRQPG
jgi:hypothetical protein